MFGRYKIKFSYQEDGRRVRETDIFWGDNTQEAVDTCRSENLRQFADQFGRIEYVYKECNDCWDYREDWEYKGGEQGSGMQALLPIRNGQLPVGHFPQPGES